MWYAFPQFLGKEPDIWAIVQKVIFWNIIYNGRYQVSPIWGYIDHFKSSLANNCICHVSNIVNMSRKRKAL